MILLGRQTNIAITAQCNRADIRAVHQIVRYDDFFANSDEFIKLIGDRHAVNLRRVVETSHMIRKTKNFWSIRCLVDPNAFKY